MPEAGTVRRAKRDAAEGKSPSTQAGEFVREEIHHVREGKHGARSAKQAIAIGLSKARRAGVDLPAPKKGKWKIRQAAARDRARAGRIRHPSAARSKASLRKLKGEGRRSASKTALSRQAHRAARSQSAATRSARAKKAAATRRRNASH
jgi:hypothetical protein